MRSKYEIKAEKELAAEGWIVDSKAGMSRFAKNRDFFHLFDLVAVKEGHGIRYIAIKGHNGDYIKLIPRIKEFWMPNQCVKELWRWPKKKVKKNEAWIKTVL